MAPSMTPSSDQALGVLELLEAILESLPPKDVLLNAQRVSKYWNAAITASPTLQQTLFFLPKPSPNTSEWQVNPFLPAPFWPWFVIWSRRAVLPQYDRLEMFGWNNRKGRLAFLRPNASWRRMLVVQPAPERLGIARVDMDEQDRDTAYAGHLDFVEGAQHERGVRMGPLYDLTIQFLRFQQYGTFGVTIKTCLNRAPDITLYLMNQEKGFEYEDNFKFPPRDRTFESKAKNKVMVPDLVQTPISHPSTNPIAKTLNNTRYWDTDLTRTRGGIWVSDLKIDVYGHVMVPKRR